MSHGRCPKCGYIFTDATTLEESNLKPKKGDVSFCLNCGAVNQFDEVGVKTVNIADLPPETRQEVAKIKRAWSKMRRRSGS